MKSNRNAGMRNEGPSLRDMRREANRRKKRRIIGFIVCEILALCLIFGYAYFLRKYAQIQRYTYAAENVENHDISVENIKKMEGYWNIAVFGVDSRNSSVGKGNNSDVIMIVSVNQGTGDIKIVSVYRDTYLDTGNGKYAKINNAYAVGGPEQAVKALNKNLDLNITDYITFNWKAVATAINLLGGVDIEITPAEFKYINGYITSTVKGTDIGSVQLKSAGMQHLDGIQAVAYARLRYMDSDFERTARQRRVLEQAFEKAKKADPRLLIGVMDEVLPMVATNLTWEDGLEVIGSIARYNLKDTGGFPTTMGDSDMGARGWNVIPKTLESNVLELHTFLFGNEDYVVSNTVKKISEKIAADAGKKVSGTGKSTESTEKKSTNAETDSDDSTKISAKTTEPETDIYGDTLKTSTKSSSSTEVSIVDGPSVDSSKTSESSTKKESTTAEESTEPEEGPGAPESTKASTAESTKATTVPAPVTTGDTSMGGAIVAPNKPESTTIESMAP